MFGRGSSWDAAAEEQLILRQGRQSVMDYEVEFRILVDGLPNPLLTYFYEHFVLTCLRGRLTCRPGITVESDL